MSDERNLSQIVRKDAKECFVESLNDAFPIGKIHFVFAAYDLSRPAGSRQTNNVHIYIDAAEFLELCRKLNCGELRFILQNKKNASDKTPLYHSLGGTSAEKLARQGRARSDGKSLSRTVQLLPGNKDLLFIADSGPGEADSKGLIVPKFGRNPENHVAVSMTLDSFSELMLLTQVHYNAWLSSWYCKHQIEDKTQSNLSTQTPAHNSENGSGAKNNSEQMF